IKLGIIGAGRWGINHVRTANQLLDSKLTVCDFNPRTSEKIAEISSGISFTTKFEDIIKNPDINAVIIATPAETHYEIAKKTLLNGKNVLVEKPITLHSSEAKDLINIAEAANLKLMVGHVLLFHPAIRKIKDMILDEKLGRLQYIYSNRLNLGSVRSEENILWSFAPHDISVIQYLLDSNPLVIDAKGAEILQNNIEDTTITYLSYPGNIHAHIFVSWLHPFKEQRLVIIGTEGMFVFEDSSKTDKLKFYPKGFRNINGALQKFEGDFEIVDFENLQPLAEEQKHFFDSIINNHKPLTDGVNALEVLEILEKAQFCLKSHIKIK
ncbi:MAG TPA: Gfo/Idh/MocA family oxidoreductase, partial [Ignavibacteriaceae bacterium]|nr:Gfo/Idh/MocA family oxidoreductase [Ignavibacteriaceae bacterium]